MKELGITGVRVDGLLEEAQKIRAELDKVADADTSPRTIPVRSVLPDAPVEANILVPPGWQPAPAGSGRDERRFPRAPGTG
jgi:hypothetical protein